MHLFRSTVIDAPVAQVWATLRHFDGVVEWNPGVAAARMEEGAPSDRVGAIRHLTLPDGGIIRETLLALDDRRRSFTYDIIESPLPVRNYVATQAFHPITDGERTYATWEVTFDCDPADEAGLAEVIAVGIFEAGMAGMKQYFEQE